MRTAAHEQEQLMTPSNVLSLARGPLALLFLIDSPWVRVSAVLLAMITDGLDGFVARRFRQVSRLGTWLDPVMDKFFVLFAAAVFFTEGTLSWFELGALMSRDVASMIFGIYLVMSGRLSKVRVQAIWSGKITTFLQFTVLMALCFGMVVPLWAFQLFILLGGLVLLELAFLHGAF